MLAMLTENHRGDIRCHIEIDVTYSTCERHRQIRRSSYLFDKFSNQLFPIIY